MNKGLKEIELQNGLNVPDLIPDVSKKRRTSRQPVSILSKTSAVILLIIATVMVALSLAVRQPTVLVVVSIELLIVTFIMIGVRWVPLLGSILGSLILFVFISATSYPLHHLTHPKDAFGYGVTPGISFLMFTVMLTLFWCAATLVVVGIAAVVQNYTQRVRRTPTWFKTALAAAIGVWFGALILGSLAQPTPTVIAASSNGTPTVHLGAGSFSQSSITLSKGSRLMLVDDGDYHHNISNGTWKNGQPAPQQQSGAPTISHVDLNGTGKSFTVGPFSVAGTYHLYCALHTGMMLTIIVQ